MYSHLSDLDRSRAIGFIESGESLGRIANRFGVGKTTIFRLKEKWNTQHSVLRRPGTGLKRVSTAPQDAALVEFIRQSPFATVREACLATNFPGGRRTACNRLHQEGIKNYNPAEKPFLTEANKEARLRFAQQYVEEPLEFWQSVVFSDEKTFQSCHSGPGKVYREKNQRYSQQFIKPSFNSGRFSVNVWSWISYQGPGVCWHIDERLTAAHYADLMENIMLPSVNVLFPDNNFIFQQVSEFFLFISTVCLRR